MKKKGLKVASDLTYTIMATILLNIVLQIIIYPTTTKLRGEEVTGQILYFIGMIYIFPQALGTSLSHTRLIIRKEYEASNRDFVPYVIAFSSISALICGGIGFSENDNPIFVIIYGVFSVLYLLRTYASVEFKLTQKFNKYFLFFCIICFGYLIGFGLYLITDIWLLIFLLGEIFALIYSFTKGNLFKNDHFTPYRKKISKTLAMVVFSIVIRDCVNQFDRVILKQLLNDATVTRYNAVSLISKTILMLVQPLNSLILSYLTTKDAILTKKQLFKFSSLTLCCGAAFFITCIIGTPIFVKLFYPDLYDLVMPYNLLVNLGLIIGFISTMFMSILLTQGKTAIQMTIQCIWGLAYIITAYYFVGKYEVWGLAVVTLVANTLKLIVAIAFTFYEKNPSKTKYINQAKTA